MIAAVFAALFALLATIADQPADVGPGVQSAPVAEQHVVSDALPAQVGHAAEPAQEIPARPAVHDASLPPCQPGEQWQGDLGCVAVQLPEETTGRATD